MRGKTGVPGEKPLGAEKRTKNLKLNPRMTPSLGIEPGPQWWEASALTTAPSLHPKYQQSEMSKWYSCERYLKKPDPMLARDQALSRRSRPYRRKDRVSKIDINTLTSYRDNPTI